MTLPAEDTLSTLACGACRVARYCSVACQKAHWRRAHKEAAGARHDFAYSHE